MGNELRQYDLGMLTVGLDISEYGILIPPKVERFQIDGYCSREVSLNVRTEFFVYRHMKLIILV